MAFILCDPLYAHMMPGCVTNVFSDNFPIHYDGNAWIDYIISKQSWNFANEMYFCLGLIECMEPPEVMKGAESVFGSESGLGPSSITGVTRTEISQLSEVS